MLSWERTGNHFHRKGLCCDFMQHATTAVLLDTDVLCLCNDKFPVY